jgi:HSP20 family protein
MANKANVQVWSPSFEADRFGREFGQMMDRFFGDREGLFGGFWAPSMEAYVDRDKMVARFDLPGIDPSKVEVTVDGDTLIVRGSREDIQTDEERNYVTRETRYGAFERMLTLPRTVKKEDVRAEYRNGVLQLTMPLAPEHRARRVPIETGAGK